jgi:integrase/recombinase XerD
VGFRERITAAWQPWRRRSQARRPRHPGTNGLINNYPDADGHGTDESGAHALCASAATNALDHQADIVKVQEWLGHANIATTCIYVHRRTRPEDSPTFKVAY